LQITFVSQQRYVNLCWAACAAMVTGTAARETPAVYGHLPVTVSAIASQVMAANLTGNCAPGAQAGLAVFDRTCFPDCAFKYVLNLPCRLLQGTIPQQSLLDEIGQNGHPPILLLQRNDGSTHVILLSGYHIYGDGTVFFDVCDPMLEGPIVARFDQLNPYGSPYAHLATWEWTYVDVGPALEIG
jgi:hypothetical protein